MGRNVNEGEIKIDKKLSKEKGIKKLETFLSETYYAFVSTSFDEKKLKKITKLIFKLNKILFEMKRVDDYSSYDKLNLVAKENKNKLKIIMQYE